jgi:hypothetical protein
MHVSSKGSARLKGIKLRFGVTFDPDDYSRLLMAFAHFRITRRSEFFRACALTLIEHYERGDKLLNPLLFQTASNEKRTSKTNGDKAAEGKRSSATTKRR